MYHGAATRGSGRAGQGEADSRLSRGFHEREQGDRVSSLRTG